LADGNQAVVVHYLTKLCVTVLVYEGKFTSLERDSS
jgi:hypothetical protein